MYKDVQLFINGEWTASASGRTIDVINPATEEVIGKIAHADRSDLDRALEAAKKGFETWRNMSAFERSKIMRRAADLLRERAEDVARLMTQEQGKPLAEAKMETLGAADTIDWFAEEARRTYGRLVPARVPGAYQMVIKEPVGPVAAFTPWNFPINQVVRKLSAALAAGCSIIVKAPEETPASPAELIRAYADAGVPAGVINLVYGVPAEISEYLIPHPVIKKISFTGSTPVGKQLAALAGQYMKRATMELGGHAPAMVFDDVDVEVAAKTLAAAKFRNAGQVCVSPTRFLVQKGVFNAFVDKFVTYAEQLKVGNGLEAGVNMGPVANKRRIPALEALIDDALAQGAQLRTGGKRIGNKGYFFQPTVLTNIPLNARVMNEEPFGPLALINSFESLDEVIAEANRLPFGLAAYAFAKSAHTKHALAARVESGMLTINHLGLALPELPFGGIKDSGYGSEGGTEAIEAYINTKLVTQLDI
ncbi:aldehyde dehydrogenase [Herbaspirillum rubrisubalbicans]|uniref:NAD-dependent succinate-semialdehyde dehydrogenase n=1 Tax=Herbaspirillum rubrisubalbicans TaxID=80842 RepID=UPI000DC5D1E6|nr:NAD-dependent succinate-semialdehyde dehydrogenase [Herbaspirillum rubrisubalbicans]MCP1576805.1 succinate-semialdehyde dehydrogenase/glutarate-semialdehyde dehydrogenase [Herbaspirillum rubrisubalbicans]RAN49685.1 aldehyde dehydrogenase [Herbaspirillum rubrisubalbicans]